MGFDDVIPHLGGFGRYQKSLLILLCLPIVIGVIYSIYSESSVFKAELYNSEIDVSRIQICATMSGFFIFGLLSDVVGRKSTLIAAFVLQLIFGFVEVTNTAGSIGFLISEAVIHATFPGVFLIVFVMAIEIVRPERRAYSSFILMTKYALIYVPRLLTNNEYVNSKWILSVFVLASLLCVSYQWIMPESVRWLQAKRRKQKAVEAAQKTARANRIEITAQTLHQLFNLSEESQRGKIAKESSSSSHFLLCLNLVGRTLIIVILFCVNDVCFWWFFNNDRMGLDYGHYSLGLIAILVSATVFMIFMPTRWGRRPIIAGAMLLAAGSALLIPLVGEIQLLSIIIGAIGFFAITVSNLSLKILTAEQFPTVIRTASLGVISFVGTNLTFFILMNYIYEEYNKFNGGILIITALLLLLLPEMLNKPLPDTLNDVKYIGKKEQTLQDVEQNIIADVSNGVLTDKMKQ